MRREKKEDKKMNTRSKPILVQVFTFAIQTRQANQSSNQLVSKQCVFIYIAHKLFVFMEMVE